MDYTYGYGARPLPGYTIRRAVGRGAFGEVYFAVSDGGREVALKRLGDNAEIELRGVRRCLNIKSPHLVSVFDIMTGEDGRPYIVMEFVAGSAPSLRHVLDTCPRGMDSNRALSFFRGAASALACLHGQNIVHRDLKPENIFLDGDYVKIGDYGLAKHIRVSDPGRQTVNLGTVHYMAPEIATGRYDHRVDIYALGVLLFEMLTGQPPFMGKDIYEIALKHASAAPDTAALPAPFAAVVARAIAKDPRERYDSVEAMAADLGVCAGAAQPAGVGSRAGSCAAPEGGGVTRGAVAAPASGPVRLPGLLAGGGWVGRAGMTVMASLAVALALALAPEWMGRPFDIGGSWLGTDLLPFFIVLAGGSFMAGAIALWFHHRATFGAASAMACRLVVASAVTLLTFLAFCLGPYVVAGPQTLFVGLGLAQPHSLASLRTFLFVIFAALLLVDWLKLASPDRGSRVSLAAAAGAGMAAGVMCLMFDVKGCASTGGLAAGLTLCVGFISPTVEDVALHAGNALHRAGAGPIRGARTDRAQASGAAVALPAGPPAARRNARFLVHLAGLLAVIAVVLWLLRFWIL